MKEEGYQEFWTSGKYWTSTESTNADNNTPLAWEVYLSESDEDFISSGLAVMKMQKAYGGGVRPFTAF